MWGNTLYFDGSDTTQSPKAGAGCVIMDSNGYLVIAAAYNLRRIFPKDVAIVEAIALINGLKLAQKFNIRLDHVKGDNTEVINHVNDQAPKEPKPRLREIIVEIKEILNVLNVDSLASEGSTLGCARKVYNSEDELPTKTAQLFRQQKFLSGGGAGNGNGNGNGGSRNFNQGLFLIKTAQLVRPEKSSNDSGGGGNGGSKNLNQGPSTNYGSSSSSNTSSVKTVGMVGAAIAGIAMIGYRVSKLLQGD